jgi:hypothetical protein
MIAKTRSIPYWITSVFSSTVTDLVLIYESVTYESLRTNELNWTLKVKVKVTLRLAIYRQSVRLGAKPYETLMTIHFVFNWALAVIVLM